MNTPPPEDDGSWLCPEGAYRDVVKAMCAADPRLKQRDLKNFSQGTSWHSVRKPTVIALELTSNQLFQRQATFKDTPAIATYLASLNSSAKGNARCSVYLVEGLVPDIINVFGSHFGIHPSFFASHERTVVFSAAPQKVSDNYLQPSLVRSNKTFVLKYFEPLSFTTRIKDFKMSCAATGRHIGITRFRHGFSQVGIVRRKISFWSKENSDGGWDCVILCDPPVTDVRVSKSGDSLSVDTSPFQGGYVDFSEPDEQLNSLKGPPRTCALEDILFYLENHAPVLKNSPGITIPALFAKKIVISHYMKLIDYVAANFSGSSWKFSRQNDMTAFDVSEVEKQWSDVQAWERRCNEYCEDMEGIFLSLGIPFAEPDLSESQDWSDCGKDFQFILMRLKLLKHRAEQLNSTITALASIAGNRQALYEQQRSIREAESTRALTVVGLVFIPLAYTSALFSMSDEYRPGAAQFWVYFAVSVPLILAVLLAYYILDNGINKKASGGLLNMFLKSF